MSLAIVPVSVGVWSSYPAKEQHYNQMECAGQVPQFNLISNLLCCRDFLNPCWRKALFKWGNKHSPVLYNQFGSSYLVLQSDMSLGLSTAEIFYIPIKTSRRVTCRDDQIIRVSFNHNKKHIAEWPASINNSLSAHNNSHWKWCQDPGLVWISPTPEIRLSSWKW